MESVGFEPKNVTLTQLKSFISPGFRFGLKHKTLSFMQHLAAHAQAGYTYHHKMMCQPKPLTFVNIKEGKGHLEIYARSCIEMRISVGRLCNKYVFCFRLDLLPGTPDVSQLRTIKNP